MLSLFLPAWRLSPSYDTLAVNCTLVADSPCLSGQTLTLRSRAIAAAHIYLFASFFALPHLHHFAEVANADADDVM